MVESRLPWWLVLLLGVWVASLSVWSWSRASRELRWGAGLLSLVYLGLLCVALGGDPRVVTISGAVSPRVSITNWSGLVSGVTAVLAAVMLLGRPSVRGQWSWFLVLTLANSANCFARGVASVGWALLAVSALVCLPLGRELLSGTRSTWAEWLPVRRKESSPIGLMCGTGFVLALALIGTWRYTVRVETTRATASHRFSAIPSADRIRAALEPKVVGSATGGFTPTGLLDLSLGRRADVMVLLAVLAFLALAMPSSACGKSEPPREDSSPHEGNA